MYFCIANSKSFQYTSLSCEYYYELNRHLTSKQYSHTFKLPAFI